MYKSKEYPAIINPLRLMYVCFVSLQFTTKCECGYHWLVKEVEGLSLLVPRDVAEFESMGNGIDDPIMIRSVSPIDLSASEPAGRTIF